MVSIYLSQRYQTKSDILRREYREKIIDHEKYKSSLEVLQQEELKRHPLAKDTIEKEIWEYEAEQEKKEVEDYESKLEAERSHKRAELEAERSYKRAEELRKRSPQQKYRDEIPHVVEKYRKESKNNRRIHNFFQWIIIIGSILVTSATSAIGISDNFKWVGAAISIFVTVSAGATGYFKFRERSFNLQQTADAIEHEYKSAGLGIYAYKDLPPEKALVLLAERVESLILEQQKKEQLLEQTPEARKVGGETIT